MGPILLCRLFEENYIYCKMVQVGTPWYKYNKPAVLRKILFVIS